MPCDVRLDRAEGTSADAAQLRVRLHRRPANSGPIVVGTDGQIAITAGVDAGETPIDQGPDAVEWMPYEPGDRLEVELEADTTRARGSAMLRRVSLALRARP